MRKKYTYFLHLLILVFLTSCSNEDKILEPNAAFTFMVNNCTLPYHVQFTSSASGEGDLNYLWTFGDGTISTEKNPLHVFTKSDIWNVELRITDENGEEASVNKSIHLNSESYFPVSFFHISSDHKKFYEGDKVYFRNESEFSSDFLWRFGDLGSSYSTKKDASFVYTHSGSYEVSLDASCGGNTHTSTRDIYINELPSKLRIKNVELLEVDSDYKFVNSEEGIESSTVSFEVSIDSDFEYASDLETGVKDLPIEWNDTEEVYFKSTEVLRFEFYLDNDAGFVSMGHIERSYEYFRSRGFPTTIKLENDDLEIELKLLWI